MIATRPQPDSQIHATPKQLPWILPGLDLTDVVSRVWVAEEVLCEPVVVGCVDLYPA